ncbi:hypothetical protein [Paludibaculum fermentans]|uniref:DUF2846 domain-containing protein n=1 Tax=Paludibaculum fermentans TaxID=1473598 RepID=A0A7S7NRD9_PALFE|nr:hypothetical protein [Paludibaculum fermentans]QOY88398.1 hypothetical protein IRI77_00060 [Paludibaculum fermentans]
MVFRPKALVCLLLAASLPGLAEDPARVYVYARRETEARSWIAVSCGGSVAAEVKQGHFFALTLAPGRYLLSVENGVPLALDAATGKDSYVRLDWQYQVGRPPIAALSKAGPEDARREMQYLAYVPSKRLHSSLAARSDPRAPVQPRWKNRAGQ